MKKFNSNDGNTSLSNPFALFNKDLCLHFLTYLPRRDREVILNTVASIWRRLRNSEPRVLLQHPEEGHDYLADEPRETVTLPIPRKLPYNETVADACFFSQLHNRTLVCCYPDGVIGFLDYNQPTVNPIYKALLPAVKTIAVHELRDQQLIICLQNDETYWIDWKESKTLKMKLSASQLKCILSVNADTIWLGMKNGQLIEWEISGNCLKREWYFTAPQGQEKLKKINNYRPNVSEKIDMSKKNFGHDILCIARNIDEWYRVYTLGCI